MKIIGEYKFENMGGEYIITHIITGKEWHFKTKEEANKYYKERLIL